jgi:antitoxin (DNA-binding transcriptional repressor) of toxin-antitoxin stability system
MFSWWKAHMEILISQAQRQLPKLIKLSLQGETIILLQGRKRTPVAKFIAIERDPRDATKSRAAAKSQVEAGS